MFDMHCTSLKKDEQGLYLFGVLYACVKKAQ